MGTNIPKTGFPGLLKKLESVMEPNRAENLRTGFRQTRIFPDDKQVLKRLPSYVDKDNLGHLSACIGEVFLDDLRKNQVEVTGKKNTRPRGRNCSMFQPVKVMDWPTSRPPPREILRNREHREGTRKEIGEQRRKKSP